MAALRAEAACQKHPGTASPGRAHSWRSPEGKKTLLVGLPALAVAVGIGYGVSCVVDLVQGCALFAAKVGPLTP